MTGPEHYAKAEAILEGIKTEGLNGIKELLDVGNLDEVSAGQALIDLMVRAAQVHATLALAAATAENDADGGKPSKSCIAWQEALA